MPHQRPPPEEQNAMYESVLNEINSQACSKMTDKIASFEKVARSLGKRTRSIHESVISIWNKVHNPDQVCALLDEKISELNRQAEERRAEGKSLIRPYTNCTARYRALAIDFLLRNYAEADLRTYRSQIRCPLSFSRPVYEKCDKEFLVKFPEFFTSQELLKNFRSAHPQLTIKSLIDKAFEALSKQAPRDPSSSQTGDLPTPSCHGLGLLARAASDAEKRADAEKRDPSNFDQLLRAMESNDTDSVPVNYGSNDGRGAPECSEDEARLTRPLSATGGSRVASRATADACAASGAAAGGGGVGAAAAGAAGGGAKASRRRNAPLSSVTAPPALTQAESMSRRRRRRRRRPSGSRAAGADAGGVGVAQASEIGGELTFTPTVPEPSDRGTRRIGWRQPPILQCRRID